MKSLLKFENNIHSRNIAFPFLMGLLLVSLGSAATVLYFVSAIYVIFFNPKISFKTLVSETILLHKRLPIVGIFPLFVLTLFFFSVTRGNPYDLLETLASHFQLLLIVPTAIGIFAIGKTQNFTDLFVNGLRIGILIVLPVSILQFTAFDLRPEGGSGNSLIFAFVLSIAGGLCLLQYDNGMQRSHLLFYAAPLSAIFMVFISFSRAPMLIVIVLYGLALFYLFKKSNNLRLFLSYGCLSAIILLLGLFLIMSTDFGQKHLNKRILVPIESLINGSVKDNSFNKRLDLQITGYQAFIEQPLLGYGLTNTVEAANSVSIRVLDRQTKYQFSHLHNDYLTYAVAGGVFTLFQFILILLTPIIISRNSSMQNSAVFMHWFSYFVSLGFATVAITNVVLGHDIMSTFFSVCLILIIVDNLSRQCRDQ